MSYGNENFKEAVMQDLRSGLRRLEDENASLRRQVADLQETVAAEQTKRAVVEMCHAECEKEKEAITRERDEWRKTAETGQDEVLSLGKTVADLTTQLQAAEDQIEELESLPKEWEGSGYNPQQMARLVVLYQGAQKQILAAEASAAEMRRACERAAWLYDQMAFGPLEAAAKYGPNYEPPSDKECLKIRQALHNAVRSIPGTSILAKLEAADSDLAGWLAVRMPEELSANLRGDRTKLESWLKEALAAYRAAGGNR